MLAAMRPTARSSRLLLRSMSTLPNNKHINVFLQSPTSSSQPSHLLTYLDTNPPSPSLAIGSCTSIPPTPQSFTPNAHFSHILDDVLSEHGHQDEQVKSQARAFASHGGMTLGSVGSGASAQGGAGGAGRGGFVHLSDSRNPPDFGRIAWPEDILGSVEVDGEGEVVGRLQPSGTYRIVTNEGILGLSPFMREKLLSRLKKEEAKEATS